MIKIFLDANVLIDIVDSARPHSIKSAEVFSYLVENIEEYELFTSCDLITTLYYILIKQIEKKELLQQLKVLNKLIHVVEFGNAEIDEAIYLMEKNRNFKDFEDTIQFIVAKKVSSDYIITNDKN